MKIGLRIFLGYFLIVGLAGFFVMASVALGYWVHPGFFLFTAFVGANLFQSAFTNACPAMTIFRKLGLPDAGRR